MSKHRTQPFKCNVVNEVVQISLRKRRGRGFNGEAYHFVQCDQVDCQYADENVPPCPLRPELFAGYLDNLDNTDR